jgi:hypothetical protein
MMGGWWRWRIGSRFFRLRGGASVRSLVRVWLRVVCAKTTRRHATFRGSNQRKAAVSCPRQLLYGTRRLSLGYTAQRVSAKMGSCSCLTLQTK